MKSKMLSIATLILVLLLFFDIVFHLPLLFVANAQENLNDRERDNVIYVIRNLMEWGYGNSADKLAKMLVEGKIKSANLPRTGTTITRGKAESGNIIIDKSLIDPYKMRARAGAKPTTIEEAMKIPELRDMAYHWKLELASTLLHELVHLENYAITRRTAKQEDVCCYIVEIGFFSGLQYRIKDQKKPEQLTEEEKARLRELESLKKDRNDMMKQLKYGALIGYIEAFKNASYPISFGTNFINAYITSIVYNPQDPIDFKTYHHLNSRTRLYGLQTKNGQFVELIDGGYAAPTMIWSITSLTFDSILLSDDPLAEALKAYNLGQMVLKPASQKRDLRKTEWNTLNLSIVPIGGIAEIVGEMLHLKSPSSEPSFTAASATEPAVSPLPHMYTVEFADKCISSDGVIKHTFNDNLHSNITFAYNTTKIFTIDPETQSIIEFFNLTTNLHEFYHWSILVDSEFENLNIYRNSEYITNLRFSAIEENASSGWAWTAAEKGAELLEDYLYIDSGLIPPISQPNAVPNGPYLGNEHNVISFNSDGSFDLDGPIQSFEWDFGDGTFATDADPTHIYDLAPEITIISPQQDTYTGNTVDLRFSIDEQPLPIILTVIDSDKEWDLDTTSLRLIKDPISWVGYSLDGHANVTISGNITLTNLETGIHELIIYAQDTTGKTGWESCLFEMTPFVGGVWIPIDKLGLLLPYVRLALTLIIIATAATIIYVKYVKQKKERQ